MKKAERAQEWRPKGEKVGREERLIRAWRKWYINSGPKVRPKVSRSRGEEKPRVTKMRE